MKTTHNNTMVRLAGSIIVLALFAGTASEVQAQKGVGAADVQQAKQPRVNRAVFASPRALEEFPWLARTGASLNTSAPKAPDAGTTFPKLASNRALAASPRFIEEYPQLARATRAADVEAPGTASAKRASAAPKLNSAFAASPRALEEFPWFARGGNKVQSSNAKFKIAPLK